MANPYAWTPCIGYSTLFREPRIGIDKMLRSPGHDYIIALRHGHLFRIPLKSRSDNVPYWRLRAAFEHVFNQPRKTDDLPSPH